MPKTKHRIIIDTNLWISFLLTKNFKKLDNLFREKNLTLLFSQELLDEITEVVERPKFAKYFSTVNIENLFYKIRTISEIITVNSKVNLCRDEKDNFLLELANDGKATHLITGDNDLLVLEKLNTTKILTMSEYLAKT